MLFGMNVEQDRTVFARRRQELLSALEHEYPDIEEGCVIIPAAFESNNIQFRQDSSFYYFTGIKEPACVLLIKKEGIATLYVPHYSDKRDIWVPSKLEELVEDPESFNIETIEKLGDKIPGFQATAWMPQQAYAHLVKELSEILNSRAPIFAIMPANHDGSDARIILERLTYFIPGLSGGLQDISSLVAKLRRTKDMGEIEFMYQAVEMTVLAHEAAARVIVPDVLECEVQGQVDYMFTAAGARPAFPTIVASGPNSTILHYTANGAQLQPDDLVIVDCGADVEHYCGDLSRTYPVSGEFTKRQKELYNVVLEVQEYIARTGKTWLLHIKS